MNSYTNFFIKIIFPPLKISSTFVNKFKIISTNMQNQIKDINLWEWGRKQIKIAQVQMPGLIYCRQQFGPKKILQGARISGSLHMTIQTAVLIQTLYQLGAKIRWCSCNIYSTQDHAAAAVVKNNTAEVFAWKGETIPQYWELTFKTLCWPGGLGPTNIVDDGGDASMLLITGLFYEKALKSKSKLPDQSHAESEDEQVMLKLIKRQLEKDPEIFSKLTADLIGISQQTTTGVNRFEKMSSEGILPFTVINVNDSVTKSKFDNIYGCRHSLLDGIWRATDVMVSGKKVLLILQCLVFGYGDVGKGCAAALKGAGAVVYIAQIDPICALQACMQGYQVVRKQTIVQKADIFITATGNKSIITADDMLKMKNNAIVCNIGHFDNQIDLKGLKQKNKINIIQIKPQVDRYSIGDWGIIVLAGGRLVNLGCATGHPSFVMSNSFTNQTLAQIQLWVNKNSGKYKNLVYLLPKQLDEKVARLHLKALGAQLTVLTQQQAKYIGVDVNGPYKKNQYRY